MFAVSKPSSVNRPGKQPDLFGAKKQAGGGFENLLANRAQSKQKSASQFSRSEHRGAPDRASRDARPDIHSNKKMAMRGQDSRRKSGSKNSLELSGDARNAQSAGHRVDRKPKEAKNISPAEGPESSVQNASKSGKVVELPTKRSQSLNKLGSFLRPLAMANPAVKLLTGRHAGIEVQNLPELISSNEFIKSGLQAENGSFLKDAQTVGDWIEDFGMEGAWQKIAPSANINLDEEVHGTAFLKALGIDPQRVVVELTRLKNSLTGPGGLASYVESSNFLKSNPFGKAINLTPTSPNDARKASRIQTKEELAGKPASGANAQDPFMEMNQRVVSGREQFTQVPAMEQTSGTAVNKSRVQQQRAGEVNHPGFIPKVDGPTTKPQNLNSASFNPNGLSYSASHQQLGVRNFSSLIENQTVANLAGSISNNSNHSNQSSLVQSNNALGKELNLSQSELAAISPDSLTEVNPFDKMDQRMENVEKINLQPIQVSHTNPKGLRKSVLGKGLNQATNIHEYLDRGIKQGVIDTDPFLEPEADKSFGSFNGASQNINQSSTKTQVFELNSASKMDSLKNPFEMGFDSSNFQVDEVFDESSLSQEFTSSSGNPESSFDSSPFEQSFGKESKQELGAPNFAKGLSETGMANPTVSEEPAKVEGEKLENIRSKVLENVEVLKQKGTGNISLEFGKGADRIQIGLSMVQNELKLKIITENGGLGDMLSTELEMLQSSLQQQNIKLSEIDVGQFTKNATDSFHQEQNLADQQFSQNFENASEDLRNWMKERSNEFGFGGTQKSKVETSLADIGSMKPGRIPLGKAQKIAIRV